MTTYRALLNVDFTDLKSSQYQKLVAALIQAGWIYIETSAFIVETQDLALVWRGVELVAKQAAAAGQLSALTYHIQSADSFAQGLAYPAAANYPNALTQIQAKPFP